MIDHGFMDAGGRLVTLRPVDRDNWRSVADLAPRDDQRRFVAALAARYLLLSTLESTWNSLAIYAGEEVAGHVMWAVDAEAYWIGGVLVDASMQGRGIGRAAMCTLLRWFETVGERDLVRLSYLPDNAGAAALYGALGFVSKGEREDDEVVVERRLP